MCQAIDNPISSEKETFWQLIQNSVIRIPNYQREYAQGRESRRVELIRRGFVSSFFDSINEEKPLDLDFVFGGNEADNALYFNPVDGQQRLTILFLIHWYVFQRAGSREDLERLGKRFLYATRTTSEHFCNLICDRSLALDFSVSEDKEYISKQIRNQPWFTGSMESDPTIKSMLVVIDCIHGYFLDRLDYAKVADLLKSDNCPITFYSLDFDNVLGSSSGVRDLYIKMNARGISLTDFELFKADLQKKDDEPGYIDLLGEYLGKNDSTYERVKIIGKFNNEYTNYFFNLIDGGKIKSSIEHADGNEQTEPQLFDTAMMNFINEIFRMNYFCAVRQVGVPQKKFRLENDSFMRMSGNEFTNFIRTAGHSLNEKFWDGEEPPEEALNVIRKSLFDSFHLVMDVLDKISMEGIDFDSIDAKCRYSFASKLKDYVSDKGISFGDTLVRMALFEFIHQFGIPHGDSERNAYITWSRFVWKIERNTELKSFTDAIETLIGFRLILKNCYDCSSDAIIKAIAECRNDDEESDGRIMATPSKLQLDEEILKSKLIVENSSWRDALIDAEDYFSDYGQIWFLLDLSRVDGTCTYDRFITAFDLAKKIFDGERRIENTDSTLFERALLAVRQYDPEDHLYSMGKYTTDTKRFVGKNFTNHISHQYCCSYEPRENIRYAITMELLKEMIDSDVADVGCWLENYIQRGSSSVEWKDIFIKNPLLNKSISGFTFRNGFQPDAWDENGYKYIAVYTNEMKRTYSGELHSFVLASKLSDAGIQLYYHVDFLEDYIIDEFPTRYFTAKGRDVGYINGSYWYRENGQIKELGKLEDAILIIQTWEQT